MTKQPTPTKTAVRAAIYTRISLDKTGERLGVQRQLDDCTALAERLGWTVVGHYDDNDLSAFSGKRRAGFEALLTAMKNGDVDALLCWHPDRLYRSLRDLVRLLDVAAGVAIRTVNGGDLDLSTASGTMLATMLGGVSSYESAHKGERQRRAARQKAERGEPQWRNAFGFLPDGSRQPDPVTAPLVKEAYASVLAGGSLSDVVREWNRAEAFTLRGKPWTTPLVSQYLRKARNAGLRTHNCRRDRTERSDVIGPGNWPALVDEEVFWAVQAKLNEPGRAPGRKSVRQHLFTGVLRCGNCGHWLSGTWVMQKTGGQSGRPKAGQVKTHPGERSHRITYACKGCHGCSVRAELVEPLVYALVSERLAQDDAVDLLRAEHDETQAEARRIERATLLARLDEIADERADGLLTGAQAKRATDRLTARLADLDARAQDAERLRVFADLPLGTPEVAAAIEGLSADRLRAVLDVLVTLTVAPVGKGHRANGQRFDRDRVTVDWK